MAGDRYPVKSALYKGNAMDQNMIDTMTRTARAWIAMYDANKDGQTMRDAEIARLRAELEHARAADVEADILDAIEAVCELADAEHVRYREQWAGLRNSVIDDNSHDIGKVRQWLAERDIVRMGGKARDSRSTIAALVVACRKLNKRRNHWALMARTYRCSMREDIGAEMHERDMRNWSIYRRNHRRQQAKQAGE